MTGKANRNFSYKIQWKGRNNIKCVEAFVKKDVFILKWPSCISKHSYQPVVEKSVYCLFLLWVNHLAFQGGRQRKNPRNLLNQMVSLYSFKIIEKYNFIKSLQNKNNCKLLNIFFIQSFCSSTSFTVKMVKLPCWRSNTLILHFLYFPLLSLLVFLKS